MANYISNGKQLNITKVLADLEIKLKVAEDRGDNKQVIKCLQELVGLILKQKIVNRAAVVYVKKLADIYVLKGDYENGEKTYQNLLGLSLAVHGEDSFSTTEAYHLLARLNLDLDQFEKAEGYALKAFLWQEKHKEISRSIFLDIVETLCVIYTELEDYEKLEKFLKYNYELKEKAHGKDALETLAVAIDRINNTADLGHFDKALKDALKLEVVIKKLYGIDSPIYVSILDSLCFIYESCGDFETAANLYEKMLNYKAVINDEDYLIVCLNGLVACYLELDELDKAKNKLEILIEKYVALDRLEDENAQMAIDDLDNLYQELGDKKTVESFISNIKKKKSTKK